MSRRSRPPIFLIVVVGIVALGAIAVVLSRSGGGPTEDVDDRPTARVTVRGEALPAYRADDDPAVGEHAPTLIGRDFEGERVRVAAGERPFAVVFVAHWCPHCQREVQDLVAWLEDNELPDGVDVYSVSSFADRTRGNYPPDAWLEREGWPFPVLVDDRNAPAAKAFGLSGTPFWAFVNEDGTIAARASGEIGADKLERQLSRLLER